MVSKFKKYRVTGEDYLSREQYSMIIECTSARCAREISYIHAVRLGYTDNDMFWRVLNVEEV